MSRAAWALALATSVLAVTSDGAADPRAAEGRFFHDRGRREYARGRYEAAVGHLLEAYRASPNPRALFNLALAARRAGRRELAFTSLEEFLRSDDDDAARRAEATSHRDALRAGLALVRVTTDPPGALLYVGRRERGVVARSPALVPFAASGDVTILAEVPGHRMAQGDVQVRIGETAELGLRLAPRTGRLQVSVEPTDAEVVVLSEDTGEERTVGDHDELPVGRYHVRARADGYEEGTSWVRVVEGETARASLALRARPRPLGRLLVDGERGAPVRVDGRLVGETPVAVSLPVGTHHVVVEGRRYQRTVEIVEGRASYLEVPRAPR